jgi:hypothetical protein
VENVAFTRFKVSNWKGRKQICGCSIERLEHLVNIHGDRADILKRESEFHLFRASMLVARIDCHSTELITNM